MPDLDDDEFNLLLPLAAAWAREQESHILLHGIPLTDLQTADALRAGVESPEQVRLLKVDTILGPDNPDLQNAARLAGLVTELSAGLTLNYGIFIRDDHWGERRLVVHELAHTAQYERFGSIEAFLAQYLHECLTIGYPDAPLEQEAIRIEREIVAGD